MGKNSPNKNKKVNGDVMMKEKFEIFSDRNRAQKELTAEFIRLDLIKTAKFFSKGKSEVDVSMLKNLAWKSKLFFNLVNYKIEDKSTADAVVKVINDEISVINSDIAKLETELNNVTDETEKKEIFKKISFKKSERYQIANWCKVVERGHSFQALLDYWALLNEVTARFLSNCPNKESDYDALIEECEAKKKDAFFKMSKLNVKIGEMVSEMEFNA